MPVALDQTYSYRVPDGLELAPGDLVSVPLGARGETMGVVWADNANPNPRLHNRMKDVAEKLDVPPLKTELRKFVDWVADYTLAPRGMVLRMALRMGEHLGPARERVGVRLAGPRPARMTPARARALGVFADGFTRAKGDAAREAGVSAGVIDGLIDEGTLETVVLPPEPVTRPPDPDFRKPEFSLGQLAAADALRTTVDQGGYTVTLLDGVTGSGKTEVYFEAVAESIRKKRQTLILMPEIALTAQSLDRFTARFGTRPAEWHSQLSPRTRARTWAAVAANEVSVVVGARSALFLPYADLGLIVVDEEHDPAYKQEDGAHYHARDMAVVRGSVAKIPVVLASATPSVESEVNARRGRYKRIHLPERFGGAHLPMIEAIDMRREGPPRGRFIAPRLAEAVQNVAGKPPRAGAVVPQPPRLRAAHALPRLRLPPAMPELRRLAGRSPLPQAPGLPPLRLRHAAAGETARTAMPSKASPLSAPASNGWSTKPPNCSPARAFSFCRAIWWNRWSACGRNSTTWRKAASTLSSARSWSPRAIIFPSSIWSASSTPISGSATAIRARPSAPSSFCIKSSAVPVARRDRGIGFLQTHQPEHPVMKALILGDREAFYSSEIALREKTGYPPFGRLASLVITANDRHAAESYGRTLSLAAPKDEQVRVLGPAEAPIAVVRGRHRFRVLVKAPRGFDLSVYLRQWLAGAPKPRGNVRLEVDVDPQSFY